MIELLRALAVVFIFLLSAGFFVALLSGKMTEPYPVCRKCGKFILEKYAEDACQCKGE